MFKLTGQEYNSTRANPQFKNAPLFQAIAACDISGTSTIYTRFAQTNTTNPSGERGFQLNDWIEINHDGIARKVTNIDAGHTYITISPGLSTRIMRAGFVWDWGQNPAMNSGTFTGLDLRPAAGSPALTCGTGGGPVGSTIDLTQFENGDFNGDGIRDIPTPTSDVLAALRAENGFPYNSVATRAPPALASGTMVGTAGQPFSYMIQGGANAKGYNATGLPSGLSVDSLTGLISGTPTQTGTTTCTIYANGPGGSASASLQLNIINVPASKH
jgi:hypothetical protein